MVRKVDNVAKLNSLFEKALTVKTIAIFKTELEGYLEDKATELAKQKISQATKPQGNKVEKQKQI